MHLTHVRKSDLNLLPALAILLEERSISRAARRYHLSQPAMSRLLKRLRQTFDDDLLIRTVNGHELTARARRLEEELQSVLPRLDRMLRGIVFNPSTADDTFRICLPDSSAIALTSTLPRRLRCIAPNTQLEIVAWHHNAFDDITHGRIDVLVWANNVPSPLLSQELYDDDVVCVIRTEHSIGDRPLAQKDYLEYPHVLVTLLNPWGHMVDEALGQQSHHLRIGLRVPYYGAAVMAVRDTDLIATLPRHAALRYAQADQVRILPFPFKIAPIRYLYAWHPRTDNEPSLEWFRKQLVDVANEGRQELDERFERWRAISC